MGGPGNWGRIKESSTNLPLGAGIVYGQVHVSPCGTPVRLQSLCL